MDNLDGLSEEEVEALFAGNNADDEEGDPLPSQSASDEHDSHARKNDKQASVPLWLVTFTDVIALMLTFFVLLYAMSVPKEEKWDDMSMSFSNKPEMFDANAFNAGSQDVISIDKISKSKALNLDYLQTIIAGVLKENKLEDVLLIQNQNRLVISLPSELLFESGTAEIGLDGKKMLFELGGVLSRVKNRLEIVGHADPTPISGQVGPYATNWELSLARAVAVASVMKATGYSRTVTTRGLSSARFDELPTDIPREERFALARRVDIIVMDDDGYRQNAFDVE